MEALSHDLLEVLVLKPFGEFAELRAIGIAERAIRQALACGQPFGDQHLHDSHNHGRSSVTIVSYDTTTLAPKS
jgi:hypothetical protein